MWMQFEPLDRYGNKYQIILLLNSGRHRSKVAEKIKEIGWKKVEILEEMKLTEI